MAHVDDAAPIGFPEVAEEKGLKTGALGLVSSVVIGMASTAPAYSLAASLGLVVATVRRWASSGEGAAIMLLAFIPMCFIAIAYQELNKAEPDCGTTFTWATRAFGPKVGWLGGWGIIAADVIVMANLAQIAGSYSYTFVPRWSDCSARTAGDLAIHILVDLRRRGLDRRDDLHLLPRHRGQSARLQYALLGIEVVVLVAFAVTPCSRSTPARPRSTLTPSLGG
jgi:amino acid transporter